MTIEFQAVGYQTRSGKIIFNDLSFEAQSGEIFAILGESGVGKSTLLRLICGLTCPIQGAVLHNGETVEGPGRTRGLVFQEYDAFEWMTVRENVEFAQARVLAAGIEPSYDVDDLLTKVELAKKAHEFPRNLSGGMRQRLAIVRALAAQPDVLCLDEPFSALDPLTRNEVLTEIKKAAALQRMTLVIVSHDIPTAAGLCDRGIVLACANDDAPARICHEFSGFRESYEGIPTDEIGCREREILEAMQEAQKNAPVAERLSIPP